jgi:hypothetical protein
MIEHEAVIHCLSRATRAQTEARQYTQAAVALGATHVSELTVTSLANCERTLAHACDMEKADAPGQGSRGELST